MHITMIVMPEQTLLENHESGNLATRFLRDTGSVGPCCTMDQAAYKETVNPNLQLIEQV